MAKFGIGFLKERMDLRSSGDREQRRSALRRECTGREGFEWGLGRSLSPKILKSHAGDVKNQFLKKLAQSEVV